MRDFPILSDLSPYRDDRKRKPGRYGSESESLFKLAQLAFELGFDTRQVTEIREWATPNPDQAVAREFFQQLRPTKWYIVDQEKAEGLASYVGEDIPTTASLRTRGEPRFTTNLENQPKKFRCSRPSSKNYENDRKFLFIDIMYNYNPVPQAYATPLAIQRDIFVSYFGEDSLPPLSRETTTECSNLRNSADDGVNDYFQANEYETDRSIGYRHADENPSRSEYGISSIDEQGIGAEQASPSFVTASISTGTSAAEIGPVDFDLDLLSNWSEDAYSTSMNEFHYIKDQQPSLVVKRVLSEGGVIVIYAWERRAYAKFSTSHQQRSMFERFACDLADQMQQFILIRGDRRPYVPPLSSLWDAACRERLVLVGPKLRASEPGEPLRFLLTQGLENFIDRI
jgi:hypothetical protein